MAIYNCMYCTQKQNKESKGKNKQGKDTAKGKLKCKDMFLIWTSGKCTFLCTKTLKTIKGRGGERGSAMIGCKHPFLKKEKIWKTKKKKIKNFKKIKNRIYLRSKRLFSLRWYFVPFEVLDAKFGALNRVLWGI